MVSVASWLRRSCISVVVVAAVVAVGVATFLFKDLASKARSSIETVSEVEAKISCTFVGKR